METIRPYRLYDIDACLAIFDGNSPHFFDTAERSSFLRFLENRADTWHYQVIEHDQGIVACAGYRVDKDNLTASLCWGMVHPQLHRRGLGTQLLLARLEAARRTPGLQRVLLDTSQHTQAFYARFGFRPERVTADGYGPGLDRWDMAFELA